MKRFFHDIVLQSVKIMLICGVLFSGVVITSCSENKSDDGSESVGANGFKIIGTLTNKDGSAKVDCDGRAQSISLVFNVSEDYTISTESCDWLSIVNGAEGLAGESRTLKLKTTEHTGTIMRSTEVYITVGDKAPVVLATVSQSVMSMDAVVKWMDQRLQNEYYWLDKYREIKEAGEINYKLTGSNFLNTALTGSKWNEGNKKVNKDDGYKTKDGGWHLFSYIHQYSASRAQTRAQASRGFGFALCYTVIAYHERPNYSFLIEHVYPSSPADRAGFKRGDVIDQVNGQNITENNYQTLFNELISPSQSSISVGRQEADGSVQTFNLMMDEYNESPVACHGLLKENVAAGFDFQGKKIGYISYLSFDGDYDEELINAIQGLNNVGATDIIIDLRNNGGGSVLSSSYFASMLLPESYSGQTMVTLKRNEKNEYGDDDIPFVSEVEVEEESFVTLPHFDLENVYFITSGNTASASEMLIMGLRAQGINAVTIGKKTTGKDCGMDVMIMSVSGQYYEFAPITFMNEFPNYNVDFSEGIDADIDFDLLRVQLKDEAMQEALDWYPMPEKGAYWGNYLNDIALGEAVARILGGTIFQTSSAEGKVYDLPCLKAATRSQQSRAEKVATIPNNELQGMYLRHEEVIVLDAE